MFPWICLEFSGLDHISLNINFYLVNLFYEEAPLSGKRCGGGEDWDYKAKFIETPPLPSPPPPLFWILDLEKHSTMGSQLYPPIYCTVYSKATSVQYSTVTQCRLSSSDSWVLAAVQWSSTDSVEEPVHWSGTDSRRTSPLIRYIPSRLLKSPSQDPVHTAQCTV